MRRLLVIIAILTLAVGCKEPEKPRTLADDALDILVSRLNDPDSFELASETLVDSTSIRTNIQRCRDIEGDPEPYKKWWKEQYIEKKKILSALDSAEASFEEMGILDSIVSYTYVITCRATNAFGAKVLGDSYIQIAPNGELIKIADDVSGLAMCPGMFPGYESIYGRE